METEKTNVLCFTCIDCGAEFQLSDDERSFFEEKGWPVPKRCPECRRQRRELKYQARCIFCGNEINIIPQRIKLNSIVVCAECKDVMLKESWRLNADLYEKQIIGKVGFYHGSN